MKLNVVQYPIVRLEDGFEALSMQSLLRDHTETPVKSFLRDHGIVLEHLAL